MDTSWPTGVLELQHVNRLQYFDISALRLLAQSLSFCTDFTIHTLSSLAYTSQVFFFKCGLKRFCLFEINPVCQVRYAKPTAPTCVVWSWDFNQRNADETYKTETTVHGYHYLLGDMVVRILDRGFLFECVTCFYCSKAVRLCQMCADSLKKKGWPTPMGGWKFAWPTPSQRFKNGWRTPSLLRPTPSILFDQSLNAGYCILQIFFATPTVLKTRDCHTDMGQHFVLVRKYG